MQGLANTCSVALCARNADGVKAAVHDLEGLGAAIGDVCDFADDTAGRRWVDDAAERLGGVDIVISNVSASGQHGYGVQPWQRTFPLDVLGDAALCEAAKPQMER